jgi:hypothetical protein
MNRLRLALGARALLLTTALGILLVTGARDRAHDAQAAAVYAPGATCGAHALTAAGWRETRRQRFPTHRVRTRG